MDALLDGPTSVVILASCWPEHVRELRGSDEKPRRPDEPGGTAASRRDRHPGAVDVLRRAQEITVRSFSERERGAAENLAAGDRRLEVALEYRDFNVTEVLAGAPELIRRYERGTPEARAVLEAAVDAGRVGVESPMSADLLRDGARGYLSAARPDDRWFEPALAELTRLDRSTSLLIPSSTRIAARSSATASPTTSASRSGNNGAGCGCRMLFGVRCSLVSPMSTTWFASPTAPSSGRCTATSSGWWPGRPTGGDEDARRYAQALANWSSGDLDGMGDEFAVATGRVLASRGEIATLTVVADRDDAGLGPSPVLGYYLEGRRDVAGLRARAATGDWAAAFMLSQLLVARDALDDLRAAMRVPGAPAGLQLIVAGVLADRGLRDELAIRADAGNAAAEWRIVGMLAAEGQWAELRTRLRAVRLRPILPERRLTATFFWLRVRADVDALRAAADEWDIVGAGVQLAELLHDRDDLDALTARADAGDGHAAGLLAEVLVARGRHAELRTRADAGDDAAVDALSPLLLRRGECDELRARALGGEATAAEMLSGVLVLTGRFDELRDLAARPVWPAFDSFVEVLVHRGELDEVRRFADAGRPDAQRALTDVLGRRADVAGLNALDESLDAVGSALAALAAGRGDDAELSRLADAGCGEARRLLADRLAARQDIPALTDRADAGDTESAEQLMGAPRVSR